MGEHHAGDLRRESAEARGERILVEELARFGWQEADLRQRPKSDPEKLRIAARLRREDDAHHRMDREATLAWNAQERDYPASGVQGGKTSRHQVTYANVIV